MLQNKTLQRKNEKKNNKSNTVFAPNTTKTTTTTKVWRPQQGRSSSTNTGKRFFSLSPERNCIQKPIFFWEKWVKSHC